VAGMKQGGKLIARLATLCAGLMAIWACPGSINLIEEVRDEILDATDTTPPDPIDITSCTYSGAAGGIQVGWTAPAERVLVLRCAAGITDAPTQGVSYSVGSAIGTCTVVYSGTASTFVDTGAGEGLKYYRAFAADLARNYAAGGTEDSSIGYNGIVYANNTTGSDGNLGFSTEPKASIQAAVDTAASLSIPAVRVAEGTYQRNGPVVTLAEGVSIYGGYSSSSWSTRAPSTYVTTIRDTNVAAGGTIDSPHHAVFAGSSITSATVVDGFTIAGATVASEPGTIYQAGLWINGGVPTIQNNTLYAGIGQPLTISMAVRVAGSSPLIQNNRIITGQTGTNYGVYLSASNSVIRNNSIDGSTVSSNNATGIMSTGGGSPLIYNNTIYGLKSYNTYGIYIDGGSAKIYNNYIHCGVADSAASGINFGSASTPSIINNIISGVSNPTGFGIYERNSSKPTEVQNNDFIAFANPGGYYRVTGGTTVYRTISALEEEFSGLPFRGIACSGNTDATPVFDSDYRLVPGTPSSIYAGGMNLSGEGFTTDKGGITRLVPWSMGAYEYNP
jgi:hypothetical protein